MNKMFMSKPSGIIATILMFLIAVATIIGLSYALDNINLTRSTVSNITTASLDASLVEQYTEPSGVLPGSSVDKVVNVVNGDTSIDALVRVKVDKECGKSRDANNKIVNPLSADVIDIDYDETNWEYIDGYFYYKNILKPGTTTTTPLFKKYTINKSAGNEYKNAVCDVVVDADIIQATEAAVNSVWGQNATSFLNSNNDLSEKNVNLGKSTVVFTDEKKFTFDGEEGNNVDLFKNFKNLTPGTTRSQVFTVSNEYKNGQGIYLRALETEQDQANLEKVNNLIKNYVNITIKNEAGEVLYNGPIWGKLDSEGPMKNYITLGYFEHSGNVSKDFVISLSVDENMPNGSSDETNYQNLIGNIKWEFGTSDGLVNIHHYIEGTTIPIDVPDYPDPLDGEIGTPYTTEPIDSSEYVLVSEPDNKTGVFAEDPIDVIYYYRLATPKFEEGKEPTITKTATELITSEDDYVTYNIQYKATVEEYKGKLSVALKDTLPKAIDVDAEDTILAGGSYDEATRTITWTPQNFVIDTYSNPDTGNISVEKTIKVKYKDVDNNDELINNVNGSMAFKLNDDDEPDTYDNNDEAITNVTFEGNVIVKHLIYGTEQSLFDEDVVLTGKIGDDYQTNSRESELEGYVLVKTPDNASGTYKSGDIIVKYYYRLDNSNSNSEIQKLGYAKALNTAQSYEYTVNYKGVIKNYVGDATLTIIDKIPYTIDETRSDIKDGIYNASKKTITWEIPIENIDAANKDYKLNYSFNISLAFEKFHSANKLTNKVSYILKTDKETKGDASCVTKLYKIPSKVIVNHYDRKTKKKIVSSTIIRGKTGDKYKTKVSKKALNKGYKLYNIKGEYAGIMTFDSINVDYYYDRTNSGIRNPYTGDDITIYIIIAVATLVIITSSAIYIGVSKKDKGV